MIKPDFDPEDDVGSDLDLNDIDLDTDLEEDLDDGEDAINCPSCHEPLDEITGECTTEDCPENPDTDA